MNQRLFWTILVALVAGASSVSSQTLSPAGVGPVRACVVRYLQEHAENACVSLEQFQRERASLAECRDVPEPPASQHYCSVCFLSAGAALPGCAPYLQDPHPPVTGSPTMDASAPVADASMEVVAPPMDAAVTTPGDPPASQVTAVTGEQVCRAIGGMWDPELTVPMERGRIQEGVCLTPEMQILARSTAGMARNADPREVMRQLGSSTDRPLRESAVRQIAGEAQAAAERRATELVSAEAEHRREGEELTNRSLVTQSRRLDLADRRLAIMREHLGVNLMVYGGASLPPYLNFTPGAIGIAPEFSFPINAHWSGQVGFGIGVGMPSGQMTQAQLNLHEVLGVRYQSGWTVWRDPSGQTATGRTAFTFAFGAAGMQYLDLATGRLPAHIVGGFVEPGALLGPASGTRFRIGLRAIVGPDFRSIGDQRAGGVGATVLLLVGPEIR